jgi:hypothetical protein
MAARNKCSARNNKSGPVIRRDPMNPLRRWRDEAVGRAATERVNRPLNGAFAMKQSPVQESRPFP